MKVLIVLHHRFELWNAPLWLVQRLRKDFPQLEIVHLSNYEHSAEELADAEVAIAWSLRPQQIGQARKLRWIHSPAAAVHQLMFPELVASDILVTNAREVHGPVVAEHVIAQILALAKKLPLALRLQRKHVWGQESMWQDVPPPREILGATLGLVGLGSIGREVAKRASALGMHIIALREHAEKGAIESVEAVYGPSQLGELLGRSDYVVLAAPLTPNTAGMMNSSRFALMKPTACLINISRGPIIEEVALVQALRSRQIAGAALDVFSEEPLPPNSPLWDLDNLLITPHTAAVTEKLWQRHYALIQENLRRYLAQEPLLAVVDKRKGY